MLILLFYVYAVAGMALFGDIDYDSPKLSYMNVNFYSFYVAMVLLFRMSTGESWNGVMHDCFSGAPCLPGREGPCGNTGFAVFFYVSFMLVGSFVFLTLFIAVIIENFEMDDPTDVDQGLEIEFPEDHEGIKVRMNRVLQGVSPELDGSRDLKGWMIQAVNGVNVELSEADPTMLQRQLNEFRRERQ